MIILLNCFLAVVGVVGIAWYTISSTELWLILGYFVTLCAVGSVSATACYFRGRSLLLLAGGLNGVTIGLLVALQVAAIVLSLGSGVAAMAFVAVPLAINVISLGWIIAEVEG
ncbi:MAG: hypothetical protein JKY86_01135 [Gammaproteobacteria bacterium]|nr:hypothetical protein [Gammaproteobacteria bacterium]